MSKIAMISFLSLALTTPVFADELSPAFGSATQEPVQIAIDAKTGLPLASIDISTPIVASSQ